MKCVRENRTITITEIPDHIDGDYIHRAPAMMVIELSYSGQPNGLQAICLDHTIIPLIVKALNTN